MADSELSIKLRLALDQFKPAVVDAVDVFVDAMDDIHDAATAAGKGLAQSLSFPEMDFSDVGKRVKDQLSEVEKSAKDVSGAFEKINIRPIQAIEAEIADLQTALGKLRAGGAAFDDIGRAELAVAEKTKLLNAEMGRFEKIVITAVQRANTAFGNLGIRSSADIQADIQKIQQSLAALGRSATVTEADFKRAQGVAAESIARLRAEMSGVPPAADQTTSAMGRMGAAGAMLGTLLGGIAAAFGVREILAANVAYEGLTKSLTAITGSTQGAAADLAFLRTTANRLGLETSELSKSWVSFAASTKGTSVEGAKAKEIFTAVAGAMATLGKSSADTDLAMKALSQMFGKGIVQMEELKGQLGDVLPGAMQAAAKAAGVTVAELTKMIETGTVLAEDLLPLMAQELAQSFSTGTADIDTLGASINRLKNYLNEFLLVMGPEVKTAFDGFSSGARYVLAAAGGLYLSLQLLGKTMANFVYSLVNWDWSGFNARQREATAELEASAAKLRASLNLRNETEQAKADLDKAAQAAEAAGKTAEGSGQSWLGLTKAYKDVTTATGEYLKGVKASVEANDAQAKSLVDLARLSDDDARIKAAQANAATTHAAGLRDLAQATAADEAATRAQIAAMKAYVEETGDTSKAHADELTKLQEVAKTKADATKKAQAMAESARHEALAAKLATDTYGDQSSKLGELSAAHANAKATLESLIEAERRGTATAAQVSAAREAETQALRRLQDALKDAVANAKGEAEAAARNTQLVTQAVDVRISEQRAIEASAKARGDEKAALEAANIAKELEITKAREAARAKQEEADKALALAEAIAASVRASGQMTAEKQREIDTAQASAQAKQNEADMARNAARALAENAAAAERQAAATKKAAEATAELAARAEAMAGLANMMASEINGITNQLNALSPAARAAFDGFKMGATDATEKARAFAEKLRDMEDANRRVATSSFGTMGPINQWFANLQQKGAQAVENWLAQKDAADAYGKRIDQLGGDLSRLDDAQRQLDEASSRAQNKVSGWGDAIGWVKDSFSLLDQEDLSTLTGAIDRAKGRVQALREQIQGARDALRGIADSAEEEVLRAQFPQGLRDDAAGRGPRIHADALLAYLARSTEADAIRFRNWLQREVVFPAAKIRQRLGIRDAVPTGSAQFRDEP